MLDRDLIRRDPDAVRRGAAKKGIPAPVDEFLGVDAEWRRTLGELEAKQAELNAASKAIGALAAAKDPNLEQAKARAKSLSAGLPALHARERELEAKLLELELAMPNLPADSVPPGAGEADNPVVRLVGEPPELDGEPRPHWEIAEALGILDLPRGAKLAGSGFPVYRGAGARLLRALGGFMLDLQLEAHGYEEIAPPVLANRASLVGTGNLPKFEDDLYKIDDDLYLIPTAETPLTNLARDEILDAAELPARYAALTSCFRREAGAAGKDTRGIQRIHQFDKVELVWLARPETSYADLETLLSHAEAVPRALGLHYRVIEQCAGDLGAKAAKCYDVEIWSPGMGKFLEVSSCSNFEAYQARRANLRYRPEPGAKPEFLHTLNGSGLAAPRVLAALLETFVRADGRVRVPEPLRPAMRTDLI